MNLAVNQTLVRSINTSVVAVLPVASILFIGAFLLGAGTLRDISLALFIGIIVWALCHALRRSAAVRAAARERAGDRQAGTTRRSRRTDWPTPERSGLGTAACPGTATAGPGAA